MEQPTGQRVIVIGSSGSGKSTLAERLARKRGVPFIELDALFWEPNWTKAEPVVFRERVRTAIESEAWVLAGNYSVQQDVSWPAADTVVWLDLPLTTALRRCTARTWRRWRRQELLWGTNREDFWAHLMLWNPEKSLISYTITRHRSRRRDFQASIDDPAWEHINFVRLRSPEEVERWFASVAPLRL